MNPTTPASTCRLLSFRKPEGLAALDPGLNLPSFLDWSQYVPLVIVYAVLLYGVSADLHDEYFSIILMLISSHYMANYGSDDDEDASMKNPYGRTESLVNPYE